MVNVSSNVKRITTNTLPTTTNLPKGNLAFGQVNGENKIYGNIGSQVVEFTANGEPIIYFADENELNTFLVSDNVPTGGWYASVAEKVYPKAGEWATFNFTGVAASSPYSTPITFNSGSANASDYFALSDEGYQIVAMNDVSTSVEVSLNATAFKAAQIGNVPINVTFVSEAWTGRSYTWTVTGVWSSVAKSVIWDGAMTIGNWIKQPTVEWQYRYLYIDIMPAESSLDVIGTITLRQIIDGESNG